jgi:hypothetical protein
MYCSTLPTSEGSSLPTRRIRRGRFDPTRPVTPTTGQCWLSDVPVIRGRTPSSSSEPPAPQERTLLEELRSQSNVQTPMRCLTGSDAYTGSISDGSAPSTVVIRSDLKGTCFDLGPSYRHPRLANSNDRKKVFARPMPEGGSKVVTLPNVV